MRLIHCSLRAINLTLFPFSDKAKNFTLVEFLSLMAEKLILLIFIVCSIQIVSCGYGDEQNGYPSYFERLSHAITNAARTGIIIILNLLDYNSQIPLHIHLNTI